LIRQGADFESQKNELLFAAIRCSYSKLIKWLIKKGCDVNAVRDDGQNALSHWHEYGDQNEEIAALLRNYGAELPAGYDPKAGDGSDNDEYD
jgi:ankyrin repeat protein